MWRDVIDVAEIGRDAAKECFYDARKWLGRKIAEADEWLADYGNTDADS